MERMLSLSDFTIDVDLHDVMANDDHLIAPITATATKGDESFTYQTAEIHRVKPAVNRLSAGLSPTTLKR